MREQAKQRKGTILGDLNAWTEANADRGLRIAALLLGLASVVFAAFYYFDRYYTPNNVPIVDQGVARLEDMVKRDPRNAETRVQLGFGYAELGYLNEAIVQYGEALKISEKHQGALIGMGHAYMAKQDTVQALKYYLQVAELNQNNQFKKTLRVLESVYYNLALIHFQQGKLDEAAGYAREALEIERTDADASLLLGQALQGNGDHEGAIVALREAIKMDPSYVEAYQALARSYEAKGDGANVLFARGMANYGGRDYEAAVKQLDQAIALTPNLGDAYQGLGLAYERLGQREKALASYRQAVSLDPELALAQAALKRLGRE